MPQNDPAVGEIWETRVHDETRRAVIVGIDRQLSAARFIVEIHIATADRTRANMFLQTFMENWRFHSPPQRVPPVCAEGCGRMAWFRYPMENSVLDRAVCEEHIPIGARALLYDEMGEMPEAREPRIQCPVCANQATFRWFNQNRVSVCDACSFVWFGTAWDGLNWGGFEERVRSGLLGIRGLNFTPRLIVVGRQFFDYLRARVTPPGSPVSGPFSATADIGLCGLPVETAYGMGPWELRIEILRPRAPEALGRSQPVGRISTAVTAPRGIQRLGGAPAQTTVRDPRAEHLEYRAAPVANWTQPSVPTNIQDALDTLRRMAPETQEWPETFAEARRARLDAAREERLRDGPVVPLAPNQPTIGQIWRHKAGGHLISIEAVGRADDGDIYIKFARADLGVSSMLLTDFSEWYTREDEAPPPCAVGEEWYFTDGVVYEILAVERLRGIWTVSGKCHKTGKIEKILGSSPFTLGQWKKLMRVSAFNRILDDDFLGED